METFLPPNRPMSDLLLSYFVNNKRQNKGGARADGGGEPPGGGGCQAPAPGGPSHTATRSPGSTSLCSPNNHGPCPNYTTLGPLSWHNLQHSVVSWPGLYQTVGCSRLFVCLSNQSSRQMALCGAAQSFHRTIRCLSD